MFLLNNTSYKRLSLIAGLLMALLLNVTAQSELKIGNNVGVIAPSAAFEIESTAKGILLPRMNTAQMNAIALPVIGLMIFNTDLNCIHFYFGTWKSQCDPANVGAWGLLGNLGTNPTTNFIGTTDNQDLAFRTNNQPRMRLGKNGHIALGNYNNHIPDNIRLLWANNSLMYNVFNVQDSVTDFSSGSVNGMMIGLKLNPLSNTAANVAGLNVGAHSDANSTSNVAQIAGTNNDAAHKGAGVITNLCGVSNNVSNVNSGTVTNLTGLKAHQQNLGTGNVTNSYGVLLNFTKGASAITTNEYGVYIGALAGKYRWGMYQSAATDKNYFAGHLALGNQNNSPDTSYIYGTNYSNVFKIEEDFTTYKNNTQLMQLATEFNPPAAYPGGNLRMIGVQAHTKSTATNLATSTLSGITIDGNHKANTVLGSFFGINSSAMNGSTGIINTATGISGSAGNNSTGTITNAIGVNASFTNAAAGGIMTNGYALKASTTNTGGTITNGYGLHIGTIVGVNNWGVYQQDATNKNYFAGNTGIGITVPAYKLDVSATTDPMRIQGLAAGANTDDVITLDAGGVLRKMTGNNLVQSYAWTLDGNTVSVLKKFGTKDNYDLPFITNNLERMRISNTGNVGIGNAAPTYKLDVNGSFNFANGAGFLRSYNGAQMDVEYSGGADATMNFKNATAAGTTNFLNDTGTSIMSLKNSGNVGIGTTNPLYYLDINAPTNPMRLQGLATGVTTDDVLTADAAGVVTRTTANNFIQNNGWALDGNTAGAIKNFGTKDNYDLPIVTNNTEKMRITSTGNIGIGMNAPTNKLDVVGNIKTNLSATSFTGIEMQPVSATNARLRFTAADNSVRYTFDATLNAIPTNDLLGLNTGTVNNAMVWKGDGNIGVGITNPTYKLDISATTNPVRVQGLATGAITDDLITSDAGGVLKKTTTSTFIQNNAWALGGNTAGAIKNFGTKDNFDLPLITNDIEKMRILANGNIGIGTTAPTQKLHISNGNINIDGSITPALRLNDGTATALVQLSANALDLNQQLANPITFKTNNMERMRVASTGNVGVATTTPNSTIQVNGSFSTAIATKIADYTATANDHILIVDATAAVRTMTLPTAVGIAGRQYIIKKKDNSANNVIIAAAGAETIDGVPSVTMNIQWQVRTLVSDGTNWMIISNQ
jgi:hypothetical protein